MERENPIIPKQDMAETEGQVDQEFQLESFEQKMKRELGEMIDQMSDEEYEKETAELQGEYEKEVGDSKHLSEATGEYFKSLIPKSSTPPNKEYAGKQKAKQRLVDALFEFLKNQKQEISKVDYVEGIINIIRTEKYFEDRIGDVSENEYGQTRVQSRGFTFKQEGGANFIKEEIDNYVSPNIYGSIPSTSNLIIKNIQSGIYLDLEALLPENIDYCPGQLYNIKKQWNEQQEKPQFVRSKVDLNTYLGTKGAKENFCVYGDIYYGDLTKKGGILSLFHEVAHSWQQAYYSKNDSFYNFYISLLSILPDVDFAKRISEQNLAGKLREKNDSSLIALFDELKELGVEIDIQEYDSGREAKADEIKISHAINKKTYIIKSQKFNELLRDYERKERDAWAHSIKTIRFLRRNGFDPEPELKSAKDLKEYVHSCLSTHQEYAENMVTSVGGGIKFSKLKKKEQEKKINK